MKRLHCLFYVTLSFWYTEVQIKEYNNLQRDAEQSGRYFSILLSWLINLLLYLILFLQILFHVQVTFTLLIYVYVSETHGHHQEIGALLLSSRSVKH
jgi:hypothetical protein